MAGVPLVAAETDAEAQTLARRRRLHRHLKLIRGEPIFGPPAVAIMDRVWSDPERLAVESRLSVAAIGGPATVRRRLAQIVEATQADELIFTSDLYDHALRVRSCEFAAEAMKTLMGSTASDARIPVG